MNDKELADRIVALGGIARWGHDTALPPYICFDMSPTTLFFQDISGFVRDWRVAGALMEATENNDMLGEVRMGRDSDGYWVVDVEMFRSHKKADSRARPLPRAICEACVEALTDD